MNNSEVYIFYNMVYQLQGYFPLHHIGYNSIYKIITIMIGHFFNNLTLYTLKHTRGSLHCIFNTTFYPRWRWKLRSNYISVYPFNIIEAITTIFTIKSCPITYTAKLYILNYTIYKQSF